MKKVNIIFVLLALFVVHPVLSQDYPITTENEKAWQTFSTNEGGNWKIHWSNVTGLPRMLYNSKTKPYLGDAETVARTFLAENKALFSMKNGLSDLELVKNTENRHGLRRVTFQQRFDGVKVEGAKYKIQMDKKGSVLMANGLYYPDINVSAIPTITKVQSITKAKTDLDLVNPVNENVETELVILPMEKGVFELVWKVTVFAEKPLTDWLLYIDAQTGVIVEKRNRIADITNTEATILEENSFMYPEDSSLSFAEKATVTGSGYVYPTYPGDEPIGDEYFPRLNGNGRLQGTYVTVFNDRYNEAVNSSEEFYYDPTSTHFDEANVYYHVDDFRNNFINDLGSPGFSQIGAHVHSNTAQFGEAAGFLQGNQDIYFGDGGTCCNYFSREAKIIYHEYVHAIIYDIEPEISFGSTEEGAIGEGLSDYFAGAYTDDSEIVVYAQPSLKRDMEAPSLSSYSAYDMSNKQQHEGGEFLSAVLWDIRGQATGDEEEIDFIVYDAISGLSGDPNFLELLAAMITADQVAHSGKHAALIISEFSDWGILGNTSGTISSNTTWPSTVYLTGNTNVANGATLTILPGTHIYLEDNKSLTVQPGGKLIAEGTEDDPIYFQRADPANDWNEIALNSSEGNTIEWALFDGGYINLSIASKNNTIEHSTFTNATHRGIEGWNNQDGSGNASATISYTLIENSGAEGIAALYLDLNLNNTTIQNNDQDGLYVLSSTVFPFYQNLITNNGQASTSYDGVSVVSSGTFYMLGPYYVEGYNEISNNEDDQILNDGDTIVGAALGGDGGYNSVKGNFSGSHYLVDNISGSSVNSYGTWWGQTSTSSSMFTGTVSGSHLTSDPTSTPGNDGESPSKAVSKKSVDFESHFDEAEQRLISATDPIEKKDRLHKLYQVEGLADNANVTSRFQSMALNATQGVETSYGSKPINASFQQLAKVLYTKSLIRNEEYVKAKTYLEDINPSEMSGKYLEDYLHLKVITETYHGLYKKAHATIEDLYANRAASGQDIEEFKARYLPLEENILSRLDSREGSTHEEQKSQIILSDEDFGLQTHPNPFNPVTTISFSLQERSFVSLKVYDLLGREVAVLVDGYKTSGLHTARLNATRFSSGVYIYQLKVGNKVLSKKMTLLK